MTTFTLPDAMDEHECESAAAPTQPLTDSPFTGGHSAPAFALPGQANEPVELASPANPCMEASDQFPSIGDVAATSEHAVHTQPGFTVPSATPHRSRQPACPLLCSPW